MPFDTEEERRVVIERVARAIDPDCFDRTIAQLGYDDGQIDEMVERREAARDLARRIL